MRMTFDHMCVQLALSSRQCRDAVDWATAQSMSLQFDELELELQSESDNSATLASALATLAALEV